MVTMGRKEIKQELQNFIDEDKEDPYIDRVYYEYMISFYKGLLKDKPATSFDKAISDFAQIVDEMKFFEETN